MGFGIWAMQFVGMMDFYRLFTGLLIMGVSIASMHFIGIDSISRVIIIVYDPFLITASVLTAIAAAFFSLNILFCLAFKKYLSALYIVMSLRPIYSVSGDTAMPEVINSRC
ncbi:hypothetical protein LWS67_02570 [Bacillus atrophaeus]|uniref:MHYT domain-containing protein n=1 Tax=Bacillus atrophaeus TaxID=1452 RepID=UPI001EFA34F7|nr:MHYT domain-containing protein [Bacillus atrophaeus]MCG8395525.1 hypothetical protein [Bacillus atrophaeus]